MNPKLEELLQEDSALPPLSGKTVPELEALFSSFGVPLTPSQLKALHARVKNGQPDREAVYAVAGGITVRGKPQNKTRPYTKRPGKTDLQR
ncbi:hypothetical protein LJC49_07725 [Ruminococcaceae bacterium OttesenSCG-928-I18]|nr:hypothetical protein [Ruminococcaceae bacterium OttesenSCG-928-I18]